MTDSTHAPKKNSMGLFKISFGGLNVANALETETLFDRISIMIRFAIQRISAVIMQLSITAGA